jgi:hypothetical protein
MHLTDEMSCLAGESDYPTDASVLPPRTGAKHFFTLRAEVLFCCQHMVRAFLWALAPENPLPAHNIQSIQFSSLDCNGFEEYLPDEVNFLNLPNPSSRTRPWGLLSL